MGHPPLNDENAGLIAFQLLQNPPHFVKSIRGFSLALDMCMYETVWYVASYLWCKNASTLQHMLRFPRLYIGSYGRDTHDDRGSYVGPIVAAT